MLEILRFCVMFMIHYLLPWLSALVIVYYVSTNNMNYVFSTAPPEVKTIVVSTDDETWLESEKKIAKRQHPEWTVVNLEAPKLPPHVKDTSEFTEGYEYMRYVES